MKTLITCVLVFLLSMLTIRVFVGVFAWLLSSRQAKAQPKYDEEYLKMASKWIKENQGHFTSNGELLESVEIIFGITSRQWIFDQCV